MYHDRLHRSWINTKLLWQSMSRIFFMAASALVVSLLVTVNLFLMIHNKAIPTRVSAYKLKRNIHIYRYFGSTEL